MKTAISFVLGVPLLGAMYLAFWALVPTLVSVTTALYFRAIYIFVLMQLAKMMSIPFGVYT